MKQLIITVGMMLLGAAVFDMIAGPGPGTLRSTVAEVMGQQIGYLS